MTRSLSAARERPDWRARTAATDASPATWSRRLSGTWLRRGGKENGSEIVIGDRIFVLAAQEPLVDEHIEVGRKGARPGFPLEQADGPRVLFAAENELRFPFALRRLVPDRHDDGRAPGNV